jgi:hypothetical protein
MVYPWDGNPSEMTRGCAQRDEYRSGILNRYISIELSSPDHDAPGDLVEELAEKVAAHISN